MRRRSDARRSSDCAEAARAQLVKDAEKMEKEKAEAEAGSEKKPSVVVKPGGNAPVRLGTPKRSVVAPAAAKVGGARRTPGERQTRRIRQLIGSDPIRIRIRSIDRRCRESATRRRTTIRDDALATRKCLIEQSTDAR